MNWFLSINPIFQGLLATLFTWSLTALGASIVFFFKDVKKGILNSMLGFGAGVMIAASFFSLLNPAFDMANNLGMNSVFVVTFGFLIGAIFLFVCDKLFDYKLKKHKKHDNKRLSLLIFSIIMHNIPEDCVCYVS